MAAGACSRPGQWDRLWGILAERRMGELLAETVEHGGDRKSRLQSATLKDIGIEKTQSYRYQRMAKVEEGLSSMI